MNLGAAVNPETLRIDKDRCPGTPSLIPTHTSCDWWPQYDGRRGGRTKLPAEGTDARRIYDVIARTNGIRQAAIAKKLRLTIEQVRAGVRVLEKRYECVEGTGRLGNKGYTWRVAK